MDIHIYVNIHILTFKISIYLTCPIIFAHFGQAVQPSKFYACIYTQIHINNNKKTINTLMYIYKQLKY
jgi:hypothetical protein